MATNCRKRYFHIDENSNGEQIYAFLDDVESADEDDIDDLMNISDIKFIAEEETAQAASRKDIPLTIPEANLRLVPSDNESKKKENNRKKKNYGNRPKK